MLTREAIVASARKQVEEHGFETVSLRAVARDLGVTAPALYDHVESKAELLALIAAEGFEEMVAGFGSIDAIVSTERLRARAVAYVGFAVDHPELFRLMFQYRPVEVAIEVDNELGAATRAFELNLADIHQAIVDGRLPGRDAVELAIMLWSAIHGVATVAMMMPGEPHGNLAGGVIDAMLSGLQPG